METIRKEYVHHSKFSRIVKPYGIPAAQIWENIMGHLMIISEFDVKLFIEIGVLFGGLTAVIIPHVDYMSDFRYIGVDHKDEVNPMVKAEVSKRANKARFVFGDAFSRAIIDNIKQEIEACKGRVYVFCDGGNKIKELQIYQKLLKPSDIISVHDYRNEVRFLVNDTTLCNATSQLKEIEPDKFRYGVFLPLFMKPNYEL